MNTDNPQGGSEQKYPIRILLDTTRKINKEIRKYRLPFRKHQIAPDKTLPQDKIQTETDINSSQIGSNDEIQGPPYNHPFYVQKRSKIKSQLLHIPTQNQSVLRIEQQPAKFISLQEQSHNLTGQKTSIKRLQTSSLKQIKQVVSISIPGKQSNNNLVKQKQRSMPQISLNHQQIGLIKNLRPQRLVNKYLDTQNSIADHSNISEISHSLNSHRNLQKSDRIILPSLGKQSMQLKPNLSENKPQKNSVWDKLAKQLHLYKDQQLNKQRSKNKKLYQRKTSKMQLKFKNEENQCENIANQLKKYKTIKQSIEEPCQDGHINKQRTIKPKQKSNSFRLEQDYQDKPLLLQSKVTEKFKCSKKKFDLSKYLQILMHLKEGNPFFRKLNHLGGCTILSIGKVRILEKHHLIFAEGELLTHFYLILFGKVVINNQNLTLKRYAIAGESISQQALFDSNLTYIQRLERGPIQLFHREEALTLNKVYLLQIRLQKYYKICKQLSSMGQKSLFNLIDNLLRINYIKKQAFFHQQTNRQYLTQTLRAPKQRNQYIFQ